LPYSLVANRISCDFLWLVTRCNHVRLETFPPEIVK
jgi:hypothetical protein